MHRRLEPTRPTAHVGAVCAVLVDWGYRRRGTEVMRVRGSGRPCSRGGSPEVMSTHEIRHTHLARWQLVRLYRVGPIMIWGAPVQWPEPECESVEVWLQQC